MKDLFVRSGQLRTDFRSDRALTRTPTRRLAIAIGVVLVAALPAFSSSSGLAIANTAWIAVIGAIALNMLTGVAGQVSLGHAAFLAIGAYSVVLAAQSFNAGIWVGVPLGGVAAAVIGLVVGLPSLRFRGFYLALTTLGLHFITTFALRKYQVSQGGMEGFTVKTPWIGPLELNSDVRWYFFLAVIGLAVILMSANINRTRTGRAWKAVRDRDVAAAIVGVDVTRYKLLAFVTSSFLAGVAGALGAYYRGSVSIETYDLALAISFVAMIIVGGLGSTAGSVIGAVTITYLPYWISDAVRLIPSSLPFVEKLKLAIFPVQSAAFGLVIIVFLLFEPRGIVAILDRAKAFARLWPYQRKTNFGGDQA
jgi:branched-chain amino acid transport system permease protein